ncbi:MAG: hypothetical protein RAK18_06940, partial [Conexivisphaerales archaeon]|nr:hypothetical protein [Conexivisphaerales archaeon]
VILATYLPFYRIHEVDEYFLKSAKNADVDELMVFVDNVFHPAQRAILERELHVPFSVGNWGSRGATWFAMLRELGGRGKEVVLMDSDNVLDLGFRRIADRLEGDVYGIIDWEEWNRGARHFMRRSRKVDELDSEGGKLPVFLYRVYDRSSAGLLRGGAIFFFGPKQAVGIRRFPDEALVSGMERAFLSVDHDLRRFISDETVLGVLMHLMGIHEVPWTVASHHYHHGSTPGYAFKPFVALAHAQFAHALDREFHRPEFRRYWLKYRLSYLKNALGTFA